MFSLSEENYLKAIYHLERDINGGVSTNAIAEKMNTRPSSVTDMVQKLAEKKAVIPKPMPMAAGDETMVLPEKPS